VSPHSRLCPPSWAGIVVIADAVIATAPDADTAHTMQCALAPVTAASLTDPEVLRARLQLLEVLGPACLAYLDPAEFRPHYGPVGVEQVLAHGDDLRQLTAACDAEDVEESGIEEITTPAFVIRQQGTVIAAAGYRDWPGEVAHLSVLTSAAVRGRGLAREVASAAVAHAIQRGKLPQWRARSEASRRVCRALGFRELGSQVSIHVQAGALPDSLQPAESRAGHPSSEADVSRIE
jgi:RimJ/RimL family protein N-acetyltransferase